MHLQQIQGHLRRLNADGGDGIEADRVAGYPAVVRLFDTQESCLFLQEDVLTLLRTLDEGAGFPATWEALGTLEEWPKSSQRTGQA